MIYDIVVKCNSTQLRMEIFFTHSEVTWFRVHGLSRVTAFSIWGLTEEVRILYHLTAARVPHHTPVICYVLFYDHVGYILESIARLLCKCKRSLKVACLSNFMYNNVVLFVAWLAEPAVRILGNIGALQKY